MYGNLKLISNNWMLTDAIINATQNIIHLQHLSIAGLQDTLLGQILHSKDAKDQQSFHFKELPDQSFVVVLHYLVVLVLHKFSLWIVCLAEKLIIIYYGKYIRSCIAV